MTTIPAVTLDRYAATPVEIASRSGHLAYVLHGGETYSIYTDYCSCADVEIALYETGRESRGERQAVYVCLNHGTHTTTAMICGQPAGHDVTIARQASGRIFGYSEQQARKRARRSNTPTWGIGHGNAA